MGCACSAAHSAAVTHDGTASDADSTTATHSRAAAYRRHRSANTTTTTMYGQSRGESDVTSQSGHLPEEEHLSNPHYISEVGSDDSTVARGAHRGATSADSSVMDLFEATARSGYGTPDDDDDGGDDAFAFSKLPPPRDTTAAQRDDDAKLA